MLRVMLRIVAVRLIEMVPVALLVVVAVFLLIHAVPGDPVEALLGERASVADREALRVALGLHLPLGEQLVNFMGGLVRGDWGTSLVSQKPVLELMVARLPATGILALGAMGVAVVGGVLLGIWGAGRWQRSLDYMTLVMAVVPSFVVGPLLVLVFAVGMGWFPVSGMSGWASAVLPSVTLGLGMAAVLARMLAESLQHELGADYMRTLKAKGGNEGRGLWRHALPNALLPAVQIFFLQLGMVLTGAVLTEAVFGWPGIGNLLVEALHQRDYPVIQGCLLMISLVYMVCVLVADVVSGWLDPRVRQ